MPGVVWWVQLVGGVLMMVVSVWEYAVTATKDGYFEATASVAAGEFS